MTIILIGSCEFTLFSIYYRNLLRKKHYYYSIVLRGIFYSSSVMYWEDDLYFFQKIHSLQHLIKKVLNKALGRVINTPLKVRVAIRLWGGWGITLGWVVGYFFVWFSYPLSALLFLLAPKLVNQPFRSWSPYPCGVLLPVLES